MSIKISGVTKSYLIDKTKKALELFQGNPMKGNAKTISFLTNLMELKNEHLIEKALNESEIIDFDKSINSRPFMLDPDKKDESLKELNENAFEYSIKDILINHYYALFYSIKNDNETKEDVLKKVNEFVNDYLYKVKNQIDIL